jgi:phosphopantetheinyl transferase
MPLYKTIIHNTNTSIFIWKIEESFNDLLRDVYLTKYSSKRLDAMKSELHQRGFLSVRYLLKEAGYADEDIYYNENGKPHLKDGKHISISHSYHFSAIIISNMEVGIDIEKNREKIKIIQNKFVNFERGFIYKEDNYIEQLTVIWGAKESLYKIYPYGGLTFKNNIDICPFKMADKKTTGYIKAKDWNKKYTIHYQQLEGFTLVYALENLKNE